MTCPHCEDKDDRIAWLESELGLQRTESEIDALRMAFGLTPQQSEIVRALYHAKGRTVSKLQLWDACPPVTAGEDRVPEILNVHVCKIRNILGRDVIHTSWGRGYALTPAGMAKVAPILTPQQVAT